MENKELRQIDTIDCVEYKDSKKEIWIRGHYPDWLCGYITGVETTLKVLCEGVLGDIVQHATAHNPELSRDPDVLSIYKFKNKKEYEVIKKTLKGGFEHYKNTKSYAPDINWDKW